MHFEPGIIPRKLIPLSDAQLKRALHSGGLSRVRHGWYAAPGADPDAVRACWFGGHLTGSSLLKKYGIWLHADNRIHVRVHRHSGRSVPPGACVHYFDPPATERDDIALALLAMAKCCPLEHTIAAIDSVIERRLLRREEIEPYADCHHRLRTALARSSPLAQSGGETRLRLFFQAHGIAYREQVEIRQVGRVDFLLGQRLVIEVDGKCFHIGEQFDVDRRRDLELIRQGYSVIRLSYRQLFADWAATQETLLQLVRRRAHRGPIRLGPRD